MRLLLALAAMAGLLALGYVLPAKATGSESEYQRARRVVCAVFKSRCDDAMRVVRCETGQTYSPWAYNRRSGASGWFQILQGNAGRVLRFRGLRMVIPSGRALFLPWTNTRVAWFLSYGGTDWREWACQP